MAIEFVDDFAGSHGHDYSRPSCAVKPMGPQHVRPGKGLTGEVLLLNGDVVVGEDTDVASDVQRSLGDFACRQIGLEQQGACSGLSKCTAGAH
ncbi:hypothetical protein ALP71_102712, partial [Pseudomonas coronafaciens pv. garcae]